MWRFWLGGTEFFLGDRVLVCEGSAPLSTRMKNAKSATNTSRRALSTAQISTPNDAAMAIAFPRHSWPKVMHTGGMLGGTGATPAVDARVSKMPVANGSVHTSLLLVIVLCY